MTHQAILWTMLGFCLIDPSDNNGSDSPRPVNQNSNGRQRYAPAATLINSARHKSKDVVLVCNAYNRKDAVNALPVSRKYVAVCRPFKGDEGNLVCYSR